jgi:hypothetical protein
MHAQSRKAHSHFIAQKGRFQRVIQKAKHMCVIQKGDFFKAACHVHSVSLETNQGKTTELRVLDCELIPYVKRIEF